MALQTYPTTAVSNAAISVLTVRLGIRRASHAGFFGCARRVFFLEVGFFMNESVSFRMSRAAHA